MDGEFAIEILFRSDREPGARYGFRWSDVCREPAEEEALAISMGFEECDVIGSNVSVLIANLEECIYAADMGLPPSEGRRETIWV
jgi:hypothetical protein